MTNEIKNIDEFIFLINEVLDNAELFIKKEIFDSSVINNSDSEYLEYYLTKRKKLLRKFSDQSFLMRIDFKDKIKI